jgi:hypothetical protein
MALSCTTNFVEQYNSCLECSKTCSQNADFTRVLAIAHRSICFSAYQVEEILGKSFSDGSRNEGEERERERERRKRASMMTTRSWKPIHSFMTFGFLLLLLLEYWKLESVQV